MMRSLLLTFSLLGACAAGQAAVMTPVFPPTDNLVRGRLATFSPQPSYPRALSMDDPRKLTDGVYADLPGGFWTNSRTTVGWDQGQPVTITFDLGGVQPIGGVSYSTAGGAPGSGVRWPAAIPILVSDDGQVWRLAGELVSLAANAGLPITDRLQTFRFVTHELQARGRYLRLVVVPNGQYTFCDEIEVCRGPASLPGAAPAGPIVEDMGQTIKRCSAITAPLWQATEAREAARRAVLRETARTAEAKSATFPPGENVARGCPVLPAGLPDVDDAVKLVDGQYADPATPFLTSKSTVAWHSAAPVSITLDLGTVQPIAGVSYSTAAAEGRLTWPAQIVLLVSDDQQAWRVAGELISLAAQESLPAAEPDRPTRHRFVTHALQTRGRYLQLYVVPRRGEASACDEIEVLKGPASRLAEEPTGALWTGLAQRYMTRGGMMWRMYGDLETARAAVNASRLPEARKTVLRTRLEKVLPQIFALPDLPEPTTFKAVLPLNELHEQIYSVYGPVAQTRGLPAFFAWHKQRFDPLTPTETPAVAPPTPSLDLTLVSHETRAEAFLLSNTTEQPMIARVTVEGLPGAPRPAWLRVAAVPWVDTIVGYPIARVPNASALPEAVYAEGSYQVPVPAGMTRLVWLTIDSATIKPGRYAGRLVVTGGPEAIRLPLTLRVSAVRLAPSRLSLGMWDYTDDQGQYGLTRKNMASAIALMRASGIDSPWAENTTLSWPKAANFDVDNHLKDPLDLTRFDEWLARWPGVRQYFVYLGNVADTFAGATRGSPEFDARVGAWAAALAAHMRALKLPPSQLAFLIFDEPDTEVKFECIAAWARAIRRGAPEIILFEDPVYAQPQQIKAQEAFTLMGILCPNLVQLLAHDPEVWRYYAACQAAGQRLWFYSCSGPVRNFDPYCYYRLSAWYAFQHGVVGMGFWSFGDMAYSLSSWNEYTCFSTPFTPAYISPTEVTDSIHVQAIHEGLEDYELLCMLRDAAARTRGEDRQQAETLLQQAVTAVLAQASPGAAEWQHSAADHSTADVYRVRIIAQLEAMAAKQQTGQ